MTGPRETHSSPRQAGAALSALEHKSRPAAEPRRSPGRRSAPSAAPAARTGRLLRGRVRTRPRPRSSVSLVAGRLRQGEGRGRGRGLPVQVCGEAPGPGRLPEGRRGHRAEGGRLHRGNRHLGLRLQVRLRGSALGPQPLRGRLQAPEAPRGRQPGFEGGAHRAMPGGQGAPGPRPGDRRPLRGPALAFERARPWARRCVWTRGW